MIIENGHTETISNQDMVSFGLDNSNGQLFAVLSELYSNPIESTIRELCTNCNDAHIMSNNELKPFIIKLPNPEKNIYNLSIRDFGPGLVHEQIHNIYRWYGRSTKTSDNNVTGCLGLGSKSPYSIASTFYVKSYNNGKCSQYTCTMSNSNEPGISETPIVFDTQEENGLEVSIPFYKDVNFKEILPKILKYFKVKPTVLLPMGELERDQPVDINWFVNSEIYKITDVIGVKHNFRSAADLFKGNSTSINNEVIQLQIYYPLDTHLIISTIERYNKLYTDQSGETIEGFKISDLRIRIIKQMLSCGVNIFAKPGKVAFAPSRESIKYTDATLIYIIKELIRASKVYEKQLNTMFGYIDTFEKAFKSLYLGKGDYIFLEGKKLFKPSKNIAYFRSKLRDSFKLVANQDILKNPILLNKFKSDTEMFRDFISFSSPSKQRNIFDYGVRYTYPESEIGLEYNKSDLNNLFNGGKLNWFDMCDVSGNDISYNTSKVMNVSFMTDFIREINRLCINKIFYVSYIELKKQILIELERVYNLDDKEFLEYASIKNTIFIHFYIDFGIDLYSDSKAVGLRDSKEAFQHYYNMIKNLPLSKILLSIGRIRGKNHLTDKDSKWNIDKCITILDTFLPNSVQLGGFIQKVLDVKDEDLLAFLNLPDSYVFNYKAFEIDWTVTYRKFAKQYLKSKRIVSKMKDVNLDTICSDLLRIPGSFPESIVRTNTLIPFYDIIKIKSKETFGIKELISQYLLYVSVKFYQGEFDKQIELSSIPAEEKAIKIQNILEKLSIPNTYRINIREIDKIEPTVRAPIRRSKTIDFSRVDSNSNYSDIKTNLYKFENTPTQEDIDIKEELFSEFLDELQLVLRNIMIFESKIKTYTVDKTDQTLIDYQKNASLSRYLNGNGFYQKIINKLEDKITFYKTTKFKNLVQKFNAIHALNLYINFIIEKCLSNARSNNIDLLSLFDLPMNRTKKIISFEGYDTDGISRRGFMEQFREEIEDDNDEQNIVIFTHSIHIDYQSTWVYMKNNYPFYMDEEKAENLYDEYFNSNKFVLLDSSLKISTGINPLPEIDFGPSIKKMLPDAKTKSSRKSFNDNSSMMIELAKYIWPEYIFINDLNRIPNKYQKNVYSFIPLVLSLGTKGFEKETDKVFDIYKSISLAQSNSVDSSYSACLAPEMDLDFTPNVEFKTTFLERYQTLVANGNCPEARLNENKYINFSDLILSKGVISKKHFSDFKNIIKLFGNKKLLNQYQQFLEDRFKVIYDALSIYINIIHPDKLKYIYSIDDIYENSSIIETITRHFETKCKNISNDIFALLKLRNTYWQYINYIKETDDKYVQVKMINYPRINYPSTRFTKFLERIAPYIHDIRSGKETNVTTVESIFKKYIKPKEVEKSIKIRKNNIDNFIREVKALKKKNELHYKINSRSKNKLLK